MVDADTGEVARTVSDIVPHLLVDGVVVGVAERHPTVLAGVSVESGEELWTSGSYLGLEEFLLPYTSQRPAVEAALYPAGPGRFALLATEYRIEDATQLLGGGEPWKDYGAILLADITTGEQVHEVDTASGAGGEERYRWGDADCAHDGAGCWSAGRTAAARRPWSPWRSPGGRVRWVEEFGSGGRTVIEVRGAWHGALYAEAMGRPVVLDLRDGSDLETDSLAVPHLTNGAIGVGYGPGQSLEVYSVAGAAASGAPCTGASGVVFS